MRSRRVLLIVFGVVVAALILFLGWHNNGPNTFQAAFQPGGSAELDLSAGGFEIRGTNEAQIRVEIDPASLSAAHSEVKVDGNHASVRVEGPPNEFRAIIYVPEQTNLVANQTIGQLRVTGVVGNKELGLNIGQIRVDVPETEKLKSVDASVVIGSVRAGPWRTAKGGFFRSFQAGGRGNYRISARLDIGDIELN